jgi:uncharacterized protein (TIGR00288 family)
MKEVINAQSVAILIDGNNIGKSINTMYGINAMLNFDTIIPKILYERGLNRLVYLREGIHISERFSERLRKKFFGIVEACHKSADISLTIHAVKLSEKVDTIIIFSGDGDYLPLINYLKAVGLRVEIVCMKNSASSNLLKSADDYYLIKEEDIFYNTN